MAIAWKYRCPDIHRFAETWLKRLADDSGKKQAWLFLGRDCQKLGFVCDHGDALNALYPGIMFNLDILNAAIGDIPYVSLLGNAVYSQWQHSIAPGNEAYFNRKWFIAVLEQMHRLTAENIVPPNLAIADLIDDLRGVPAANDLQKFLPNKSSLPEIKDLLAKGFDANSRDERGRTPLMYCAYSSPELVRELIDHGADCGATDDAGNTVLMYLCDSFDLKSFDLVLKRGADINAQNQQGYTVLDFAVMQSISIAGFVARDARITRIVSPALPEVVAEAALTDDRIFAQLLKNKLIQSAEFIYALLFDHAEKWCEFMVKLYRSRLPKFDWENLKLKLDHPLVTDAVIRGCNMYLTDKSFEFLLSLAGTYPVEIHDDAYCNLLKLAIEFNHHALQLLLKRFGNPDGGGVKKGQAWVYGFSGEKAISPLLFAVKKGDLASVEVLLIYGASVNVEDADGSALAHAVRQNQMPILKLLLGYRADPNQAPCPDLLPLKIAKQYHRKEMVALLKQHHAVDDDDSDDDETNPVNTIIVPEFKIAGTFAVAERSYLSYLSAGARLRLIREPENEYDAKAIRIEDEFSFKLGYVPKDIAKKLAPQMDKGECLWGKVIDVAGRGLEITALIYQRQIIPLDELTGFTLIDGCGFPSFAESYKFSLSARSRKLKCDITQNIFDLRHIEVVFDPDEWSNIQKMLQKCNFLAWQGNYDVAVCDGGWWDFTLRLKGGKKFHTRGTVRHPEEWELFRTFLKDSIDPLKVKGSGSFWTVPRQK